MDLLTGGLLKISVVFSSSMGNWVGEGGIFVD